MCSGESICMNLSQGKLVKNPPKMLKFSLYIKNTLWRSANSQNNH